MALAVASPSAAESGAPSSLRSARAWFADDGFPAGDVLSMAQDGEGFLWLGMNTGLVRFDGYQFLPWGSRGEPPLPGTIVRAVLSSQDGSLWLGFADSGGVARIAKGQVRRIPGGADGLVGGRVSALLEDHGGAIWVATTEGLSALERGRWHTMVSGDGFSPGEVFSLYEDRSGALWVSASTGVYRRKRDETRFARVDHSSSHVQNFVEAWGAMWATDTQLVMRPMGGGPLPRYGEGVRTPQAGWRLLRAPDESVWIAALGGGLLHVRPPRTPGEAPIIERADHQDKIVGSPRSLYQDRQNNIWVGMRGGGLVRISETIFQTGIPLEGVTNDGVRGLAVSGGGDVWVATGHNLNRFTGGHRRVHGIAQTTALHVDPSGSLWVSTATGVGRFNGAQLVGVPVRPGILTERIVSIATDGAGQLWLCSNDHGLLSTEGGVVSRYAGDPAIAGRPCSFLYTDRSGRMWVALRSGLATYEMGRFEVRDGPDPASAGSPIAIIEDVSGAIWIATSSTLTRFQNGRFTTIGPGNGLPGKLIPALVDDEQGYVWVGVNSGANIVRFRRREADAVAADPAHQIDYSLYDVSDGLLGEVHWQSRPGAIRTRDGQLWFVTGRGIAAVDPRLPVATRASSPIRFERATVNGYPLPLGPDPGELPYMASLAIDYAVPNLSAGSKFRFRHLLEGLDAGWRDAGASRSITYASLPAGSYRLRVAATGADDSTDAEAVWSFMVSPPFYQRGWFYGATAVAVGLVMWGAWQLRLRTIRKQFALVVAERTRVSREIHDTLLQSLGAVALELEAVAREMDHRDAAAGQALRGLRAKVRHCVTEARESIWELRSAATGQRTLAGALRELASDVTAAGQAEVRVSVTGRPHDVGQDTVHHLLRIAQEATTNAIRHGRAARVDIELVFNRRGVDLRIRDNGCGFDVETQTLESAREHRWGLVNMKERAERVGGSLRLVTAPGAGTIIEATVPATPR